MKQILLSSAYLPPIAYIQAIAKSDVAIIDHVEPYCKQSYRNRSIILSGNGPLMLSIPILKCKPQTPISEVKIDYKLPWQRTHWRAITAAYNNSPFFLYYQDYFYPFYTKQTTYLTDFNYELIRCVLKLLSMDAHLSVLSEKEAINEELFTDYRNLIHPKKMLPEELISSAEYYQVFSEKMPFVPNLSILDLLFNKGNQAKNYLIGK